MNMNAKKPKNAKVGMSGPAAIKFNSDPRQTGTEKAKTAAKPKLGKPTGGKKPPLPVFKAAKKGKK